MEKILTARQAEIEKKEDSSSNGEEKVIEKEKIVESYEKNDKLEKIVAERELEGKKIEIKEEIKLPEQKQELIKIKEEDNKKVVDSQPQQKIADPAPKPLIAKSVLENNRTSKIKLHKRNIKYNQFPKKEFDDLIDIQSLNLSQNQDNNKGKEAPAKYIKVDTSEKKHEEVKQDARDCICQIY